MSSEREYLFRGQRMLIHVPDWAESHEIDDSGGILYHKDGQRTSWMRTTKRMTCPNWTKWSCIDWSKFHDAH